jgi:F0F1-type ATP synthase gamma subunit
MELISTVKMKKAQEAVVGLRPFALATLSILGKVAKDSEILGIFAVSPKVTKELIVLVASQK